MSNLLNRINITLTAIPIARDNISTSNTPITNPVPSSNVSAITNIPIEPNTSENVDTGNQGSNTEYINLRKILEEKNTYEQLNTRNYDTNNYRLSNPIKFPTIINANIKHTDDTNSNHGNSPSNSSHSNEDDHDDIPSEPRIVNSRRYISNLTNISKEFVYKKDKYDARHSLNKLLSTRKYYK
jgi:hypothetical protein